MQAEPELGRSGRLEGARRALYAALRAREPCIWLDLALAPGIYSFHAPRASGEVDDEELADEAAAARSSAGCGTSSRRPPPAASLRGRGHGALADALARPEVNGVRHLEGLPEELEVAELPLDGGAGLPTSRIIGDALLVQLPHAAGCALVAVGLDHWPRRLRLAPPQEAAVLGGQREGLGLGISNENSRAPRCRGLSPGRDLEEELSFTGTTTSQRFTSSAVSRSVSRQRTSKGS